MKYLLFSLTFSVSGLVLGLNGFTPHWLASTQPTPMTPSLAGIECPEDQEKPCVDDEIRVIASNCKVM
jgi:hypothetical protein